MEKYFIDTQLCESGAAQGQGLWSGSLFSSRCPAPALPYVTAPELSLPRPAASVLFLLLRRSRRPPCACRAAHCPQQLSCFRIRLQAAAFTTYNLLLVIKLI